MNMEVSLYERGLIMRNYRKSLLLGVEKKFLQCEKGDLNYV